MPTSIIQDVTRADLEDAAAIMQRIFGRNVTRNELERGFNFGYEIWRPRALWQDGVMRAHSTLHRMATDPSGKYHLRIFVDPAHQRQGHGEALFEDGVVFCQSNGGSKLTGIAHQEQPGSLPFAHKHGFTQLREAFHSELDVNSFEDGPFVPFLTGLKRHGIRFHTLAGLGDNAENRRKLYELNKTCSADIPGRGPFFSYEEYVSLRFDNVAYRPEGVIVALHGDKWVGFTLMTVHEGGETCFSQMTGTLSDYRGKGIAKATKLVSVRFARSIGAIRMRTFNDSENVGMLAVNDQMGYVRKPSTYLMEKIL